MTVPPSALAAVLTLALLAAPLTVQPQPDRPDAPRYLSVMRWATRAVFEELPSRTTNSTV